MRVNVRLYRNTGFSLINRPANKSVLDNLVVKENYFDVYDVFVVQNVGLNELKLDLNYELARNVDYIRLTTHTINTDMQPKKNIEGGYEEVYYVLTAPPGMQNEFTCTFFIREDYITTLGIKQSDFLTGSINAAHVPEDSWKWNIPETRFKPSGVLEYKFYDFTPSNMGGNGSKDTLNLVNITVDPVLTAVSPYADIKTGMDPLGLTNEPIAVAVPMTVSNAFKTTYKLLNLSNGDNVDNITFNTKEFASPAYTTYILSPSDNSTTSKGYQQKRALDILRSYGLQDTILASYDIDRIYVNENNGLDTVEETRNKKVGGTGKEETEQLAEKILLSIQPAALREYNIIPSIFNYEYTIGGYTPHNKKVYMGVDNSYYLISKASGNIFQASPEDVAMFNNNQPITSKPPLIITADLRVSGNPFAYFLYLNNQSNLRMLGVNGLGWGNHQNNYFGQYGSELANNQYKLMGAVNLRNSNRATFGVMGNVMTDSSNAISMAALANFSGVVSGIQAGKTIGNAAGPLSGSIAGGIEIGRGLGADLTTSQNAIFNRAYTGSVGKLFGDVAKIYTIQNEYEFNKHQLEYAQIIATSNTKAPSVEFPYQEGNRERYGNYFTLARTTYSKTMAEQMDNFYDLNGYLVGGIEITGEASNWLSNRKYFNYISMTNVSFKNNYSMLEREGAAADFANVRLWKVLPTKWTPSMHNEIEV